jgi:hypothetical protein
MVRPAVRNSMYHGGATVKGPGLRESNGRGKSKFTLHRIFVRALDNVALLGMCLL